MQRIRIAILSTSILVMVGAIVLLLNFTAPNPTGRRYSSEMPMTSGQGSAQEIGLEGERILARDLRLADNNAPGRSLCICSTTRNGEVPSACSVCVVDIDLKGEAYRIPDFLSPMLIADSKNVKLFHIVPSDLNQIEDYAVAASALGVPLWLYMRVDTEVKQVIYDLAASTGGGVVHYFSVPGWVDPIDHAARIALLMGSGGLLFGIVWPLRRIRWRRQQPAPTPMPDAKRRKDPVQKAMRSVSELESFTRRTEEHKRLEIDEGDARED